MNRRSTDGLFGLLSRWWDFIDRRDIDKHFVSLMVLWGTYKLTTWAMFYVTSCEGKTGIEIAAIIAAVTGPYMALQAAAIKFYFDARTERKE